MAYFYIKEEQMPDTLYRFDNYRDKVGILKKGRDYGNKTGTREYMYHEKEERFNYGVGVLFAFKYGDMSYSGYATIEEAINEQVKSAEAAVRSANERLEKYQSMLSRLPELQNEADTRVAREKEAEEKRLLESIKRYEQLNKGKA